MNKHILAFCAIVLCSFSGFAEGQGRIVRSEGAIRDQYIVVLRPHVAKKDVRGIAEMLINAHGGKLRLVLNNAAQIFTVEMNEHQAEAMSHNPHVLQIEENAPVHLSAIQNLPPPAPLNWMDLWNLDRIDQWGTANSNMYQYCERARDVTAYIADTGVMGDHQEFRNPDGTSRVKRGVCFADDCAENRGDTICPLTGGRTNDLNKSHGTAVASILGGNTVGVAKNVSIVPLRFYACQIDQGATSTTERFCWALDWIRSASNPDRNRRPALVSLSAYARTNDPLLASYEHVINGLLLDDAAAGWTGIPVIVSANNQNSATCMTSPARMAYRNNTTVARPGFASPGRVISVGGSGRQVINGVLRDVRWSCPMFPGEPCLSETCNGGPVPQYGSNHGNAVDLYAPSHHVESAHTTAINAYRRDTGPAPYTADQYYGVKSGTSFAAPLAAGVVARILQVEPNLTPTQVWDRLRTTAQTVAVPLDTSGVDQNGNPTSNSRMLNRRYSSAQCTVEYP